VCFQGVARNGRSRIREKRVRLHPKSESRESNRPKRSGNHRIVRQEVGQVVSMAAVGRMRKDSTTVDRCPDDVIEGMKGWVSTHR